MLSIERVGVFPSDWPDACPPLDAEDASGPVFRVVKKDALVFGDFRTHREKGKLPNADPCLRAGLSMMRTLQDAIHQARLIPCLGDYIAEGELVGDDGKTRLTTGKVPSHTTWWPYAGGDRLRPFHCVTPVPRECTS